MRCLAIACERNVLSNRVTAFVASVDLDYLGLIDEMGVKYRNEIRRTCTTAVTDTQTQEKVAQLASISMVVNIRNYQ